MRGGLAYWIWAFFAICLPLQNAGPFAWDPLPRRMSHTTFSVNGTVYWNLLRLFRGAAPNPKVRAFCNSGWPDSGKSCGSIACPYSTSLCPYSQKQNHNKRCSDWDYNQSPALSYVECSRDGAKAHLTRGLHPLMADIPIISHHDIVLKNPYSY